MKGWAKATVLGVIGAAALLLIAAPALATVDVAGWQTAFRTSLESSPSIDSGRVVWAEYQFDTGGEIKLYDIAAGTTSVLLTTDLRPVSLRFDGEHIVFKADAAVYLYTLNSQSLQKLSTPDWGAEQFAFSGDAVTWMERKSDRSRVRLHRIVCRNISTGETRMVVETVPPDDETLIFLANDSWILWNNFPSQADSNLVIFSVKTGMKHTVEELGLAGPLPLDAVRLNGDVLYYTRSAGAVWQLRERNLSTGADMLILENVKPIQSICVDEERIAYASWDSNGSYVAIFDQLTGITTRIHSPAYSVGHLALRGHLLIWRGEQWFLSPTNPSTYLFAYDASDGTVTRLSRIQSNFGGFDTDGETIAVNEILFQRDHPPSSLAVVIRGAMSKEGLFPDVPGTHPYWTAIKGLGEKGAVAGFPGGNGTAVFRSDALLTRGQFAKIVVEALDLPTAGDYLSTLVNQGVLLGDARGRLNPYSPLTRAQLATLVVRAADKFRPELLAGPALDRLSTHRDLISTLGIFDPTHGFNLRRAEWGGLLDGLVGFTRTWNPWQAATRGDAAQVLWNLASWEK